MADTLETKKKNRKVLRTSFTKGANDLDGLLKAEKHVLSDIEVSWECLKPKWDSLRACEQEVYGAMLEDEATTEEQLVAELDQNDVYLKRFTELNLQVQKCLLQPVDEQPIDDDRSTGDRSYVEPIQPITGKRKFKLPIIQFKQYDGSIRDWLNFWSQFKKIDADSEIDNCDKIEYLIQATVVDSRARQIVESFPSLEENYEKIIDCMKSRFGRDDLQIEFYVRELLKLVLNVNARSQQKFELAKLYDKIETQLRALDTLGISSDKYAALLFPLIESCLPQELLRIWQRSSYNSSRDIENETFDDVQSVQSNTTNSESPLEIRLKNLMRFLRSEVENEQRIDLACEGFGLSENIKLKSGSEKKNWRNSIPANMTAAGLVNTDIDKCCIFCSGSHESNQCFRAQKMTLDERKNVLTEKKACFRCLKVGHLSRKCRTRLKCVVCSFSHFPLMCQDLPNKKLEKSSENSQEDAQKDATMANQTNEHVFLQVLRVNIRGTNGTRNVRAVIDSGSHRSYILKSTVSHLNLKPKKAVKITHCLFGGIEKDETHYLYDVTIFKGNYSHTFEVLDQLNICSEVSPVFYGPWMQELRSLGIEISDLNSQGPIEMLLGADVLGKLFTGKRHMLKCGLVAYESYVGWTLEGSITTSKAHSMTVTMSMLNNPSITELWRLDVLGIQEPTERKTKSEIAAEVKNLFDETVMINKEGRYEVRLPWIEDHPPLPTNYSIAKKRLQNTLQKLERDNLMSRYEEVFQEWESLKIIEKTHFDTTKGHFLPHRPVIKEGSTTAVRPVFDASAHEKDKPSLNQCLEKGENLIEKIPAILTRFREYEIGVISDVKKAFLQICVNPKDRQVLKFLWIDKQGQEIVYVHNRVVFGVNCSPFLLGATIDYHLSKCLENCSLPGCEYSRETIEKLALSFYVDNCVASVPNHETLNKFVRESVQAMAEAQLELRGWEFSRNSSSQESSVSVLGLRWHLEKDVLTINPDLLSTETDMVVTKRKLLSMAQKIFDPIGFTCPATLQPKLWLQELWAKNIAWDTEIDQEISVPFKQWVLDLPNLTNIEIPRWTKIGGSDSRKITLHTFVDASQLAYAAAVFCRVEQEEKVSIYLLAAKSRVAPLENKEKRKLTIPRLELLAATIGARLYAQTSEYISVEYDSYFWSDSSTVISWIKRNEEWGTFVFNRVAEIRELTPSTQWRHIPGICNPADLLSRGCTPKQLLKSKWWEGPSWLYENEKKWPCTVELQINEEEVNSEIKKRCIKTLINVNRDGDFYHLTKFSSFEKTVRMISTMFRFIHNLTFKRKGLEKKSGNFTTEELQEAEKFIFKEVQKDSFAGPEDNQIKGLNPKYDDYGLIRLESRVSNRPKETEDFKYPIVLPSKHPIVDALIKKVHEQNCHVGPQGLLAKLREHYWILAGRKTVRSVTKKCATCRRYDAKSFVVEPPPLPADRVRDAITFEITGVDFAGPLFLKSGEKAWVCLFTCAVYRCVHLELTLSLSTNGFLQVFRRFIARRGRPKIMYSDNGTNFKGTDNAFETLDWDKIERETSVQRITWRFNPPTASWWGGFFERLIGLVKTLLRKVLGKASLDFEELMTVICDCESVVNSRPLTYISNDPSDLLPLTPAMFLREQSDTSVPDIDQIEKTNLSRSMRYKQKIREQVRQRFRVEYLGQLKLIFDKKPNVSVKLDQIVLIGNDFSKRIEWPLGRVIEVIPGKDGRIRLARVKTLRGELLRPVQRLYPLECDVDSAVDSVSELSSARKENLGLELEDIDGNSLEEQKKNRKSRVTKNNNSVVENSNEIASETVNCKTTRSGRNIRMPSKFL